MRAEVQAITSLLLLWSIHGFAIAQDLFPAPVNKTGSLRIGDERLLFKFEGALDPIPLVVTDVGQQSLTTGGGPITEKVTLDDIDVGPFTLRSHTVQTVVDSAFGVGSLWTLQGEAAGPNNSLIFETLTVAFYAAYPGVAVCRRTYSVAGDESFSVQRVVAARMSVGDGSEKLRLSVGPAAQVAYQIEDYLSIPVRGGYRKSGDMLDGGVPMIDVWTARAGLALGHVEARNEAVELPVRAETDNIVEVSLVKNPISEYGESMELDAASPWRTVRFIVVGHQGDFFQPLASLSAMVSAQLPTPITRTRTPASAYEPYWKTWGLSLEGEWTKADVRQAAAELTGVGISTILFDWGWFESEGDWTPASDRFDSEGDMIQFIAELKAAGFRVGLWWAPLQVEPEDVDPEVAQHVVRDEDGDLVIDDDDLYNLSPSDPFVQGYVRDTARRLFGYGADFLYLDGQEVQLSARPDFDPSHTDGRGPLASFHDLPRIYELIHDEAQALDREVFIEICPDGRSQSLLNMPFVHLNNVGDPGSDRQVREETKWLKALRGPTSAVGDGYLGPFEDSLTSGDPANSMGVGAVLTTLRTIPLGLTEGEWAKWITLYKDLGLSSAEYLSLYDIAFDTPEGHAISKDGSMYYAFYARSDPVRICLGGGCEVPAVVEPAEGPFQGNIELHGLTPNARYSINDYERGTPVANVTADESGAARVEVSFSKRILLRADRTSFVGPSYNQYE